MNKKKKIIVDVSKSNPTTAKKDWGECYGQFPADSGCPNYWIAVSHNAENNFFYSPRAGGVIFQEKDFSNIKKELDSKDIRM